MQALRQQAAQRALPLLQLQLQQCFLLTAIISSNCVLACASACCITSRCNCKS